MLLGKHLWILTRCKQERSLGQFWRGNGVRGGWNCCLLRTVKYTYLIRACGNASCCCYDWQLWLGWFFARKDFQRIVFSTLDLSSIPLVCAHWCRTISKFERKTCLVTSTWSSKIAHGLKTVKHIMLDNNRTDLVECAGGLTSWTIQSSSFSTFFRVTLAGRWISPCLGFSFGRALMKMWVQARMDSNRAIDIRYHGTMNWYCIDTYLLRRRCLSWK